MNHFCLTINKLNSAILGDGSVGCFLSTILSRNNIKFNLITRKALHPTPTKHDKNFSNAMVILNDSNDYPVSVISNKLPDNCKAIILCHKSHQNDNIIKFIKHNVSKDTVIFGTQNSISSHQLFNRTFPGQYCVLSCMFQSHLKSVLHSSSSLIYNIHATESLNSISFVPFPTLSPLIKNNTKIVFNTFNQINDLTFKYFFPSNQNPNWCVIWEKFIVSSSLTTLCLVTKQPIINSLITHRLLYKSILYELIALYRRLFPSLNPESYSVDFYFDRVFSLFMSQSNSNLTFFTSTYNDIIASKNINHTEFHDMITFVVRLCNQHNIDCPIYSHVFNLYKQY
jgi:ketopantoate reductase